MDEHTVNRRRFFNSLLIGGIALLNTHRSLARAAGQAGLFPGKPSLLLEPIRSRDSAAVIGQAYLRQIPEAVDAAGLYADILQSLGLTDYAVASMSLREIHRRLRDRVRADFAAGLTVKLDGWILSRTEARVSALVALV